MEQKKKVLVEYSIPDDFDNKSEEEKIEIAKDIISKFTAEDLHEGHQGKHQENHNNYIEGRSILKAEPKVLFEEAKNYNDEVKVKGKGNKVEINKFFDCKRSIGIYKDKADYKEGIPTSRIKIHYSKYGYHIVPATPSELLEDK